ncbi:MAG: hypothetical protein E7172_03265 [Firmicutes bacterium]|nr:hypothetical protein [Bacillota bacterium]
MNEIMLSLIICIIAFLIVFVYDYFIILKAKYKGLIGKKKKKRNLLISELELMKVNHKFELNNFELKKIILIIALINAFIISFTSFIIMLIPWDLIWRLLIGFVLMVGLIYAIYELLGRILERKYGGN